MPTINKRFLLQLLLATLLLAGGLVGVHTVQARRIPDALKSQADRAAEDEKPDVAIRYLRQYLEFRPDDAEAQERLATLLKARPHGDPADLLLLYDKLLRTDPSRSAARREALTLSLRIGRFTDAEIHAEQLLKETPADADFWQKLATAQAGLQKTTPARASFEESLKHAPAERLSYTRYAQFLWRDLRQPKDAAAVIERLIIARPSDPDSYITRANLHLFTGGDRLETTSRPTNEFRGNHMQVMADLRKALDLEPTHPDALLLMAEQLQKQRKLAEAHDCLAKGVQAHPQDVRMVRALAWLELNRGHIGAAVGVLEDGMNRIKDGFELLVPLADLLVQLGETKRTEDILRKLESRQSPSAQMQVKYLKSRVAMRNGHWAEASTLLTQLRTDSVNLPGLESQTNLLLAICFSRRGETQPEQETLRLVLNKDPNHISARVSLAYSYLNAGRIAEAVKEFQIAVQSPYASPPTHATLVRLMARELKLSNARPADWQQLDRVVGELTKAFGPAATEPIYLRSELAANRGEFLQAASILRDEAARRPGDARLWAALAEAVTDLGGLAAGLSVLDEAQAASGDGPDVRLARAALYARDPAGLRPIDPLAAQIDTWPDADQTRFLFGLVEIFDRLGDEPRIVQTYQRLAARRPADLGIWEALGERATLSGDTKAAAEARTAATKLDASGKSAALFDAWTALAMNGDSRSAIDGVVKLFGANPDRAEACVTLAKLKAKTGENAEAGRLLERAVRLDPTRFPPMQAYLGHLAATGADDAAATVVARLARDHRWAGEPFRRAIRGAMRNQRAEVVAKVLAVTRQYVEPEPGGLGWLGDTYLAAGLKVDALACFEKATTLKTTGPDDWLRLALRVGSPDDAAKVMATARTKMEKPVFFALAASFAESNDWTPSFSAEGDKKLFAQARLSLKLSRFERSQAITLLEGFLKESPKPAEAAWAKRNLAMLLAVRGGKADRAKAMELLVSDNDPAGETADEKRSTAAVLTALSRHLDGADRKTVLDRATKVLQQLVADTRSPRDAFLLAQVFRASGNRTASTQVLNDLLKADQTNLDYHVMALEELTELGNFDRAKPFAERLLALYPADIRAVTAAARYECKAGRPEKAFALAEGYTRTADANAGDLPSKSARAAELLDELARLPNVRRTPFGTQMTNSAVRRYEDLIPTRPEACVAAAGALASDGRVAEAFALIEKHGKPLPHRLRAAAGLAALRAGNASDRQFTIVREWLDAALTEEPASLALRLNEGEFFALMQDYPASEKTYLTVLERDPRNVVALNNLAWILAPRPESSARALELVDRAVAEVGLTGELLDTRARVRIAAKQFDLAERDLVEALSQEKTPLRMFHLALAKDGQSPPRRDEARDAFRKAKDRGLDAKAVHPADLPAYRALDSEQRQ